MVLLGVECSAAACSARVEIQPNRIAATIQPHSMSLRRPIGVPGGMGPPCLTTPRAAAMAAAVARRCHASSIAEPRRAQGLGIGAGHGDQLPTPVS